MTAHIAVPLIVTITAGLLAVSSSSSNVVGEGGIEGYSE